MRKRIAIIPAGQWGTALATPLIKNGHSVRLWFRETDELKHFNQTREHPRLPGVMFPVQVSATNDVEQAADQADIIVLAAPSTAVRVVAERVKPYLKSKTILLCITKGLERGTALRASEIIADVIPNVAGQLAALSGPNFSVEVAAGLPALSVIASEKQVVATELQSVFGTAYFRLYTSSDCCGVELGGALKNVYALGVGMSEGMGMGDSARAAFITRALLEMVKIGVACGARQETFMGLSGLGDFVLTATSTKSRNHQAGFALGQGAPITEVKSRHVTVEGFNSAAPALQLAREKGVETPLLALIHSIVSGIQTPQQALTELLTRKPGKEFNLPKMYHNRK